MRNQGVIETSLSRTGETVRDSRIPFVLRRWAGSDVEQERLVLLYALDNKLFEYMMAGLPIVATQQLSTSDCRRL